MLHPTGLPGAPDPAPLPSLAQAAPAGRPRRSRRRRVLKTVLGVVAVLVAVFAGVAYWALDRYVIDHVEIADVAGYESSIHAGDPGAATTTIAGSTVSAPATRGPAPTTTVAVTAPATVTDTSFSRGGTKISIAKTVTGTGTAQVAYYVADVVLADATALRGGFAQNKFGRNIIEDPSDIAADNNAVFAVNGDYYGYRTSGIVIRNGILYRDEGARIGLAIYADGRMSVYDEKATSGKELIAAGVWNTLSFGPALLDNGEILAGIDKVEVDTNIGNHSIQGNQPRTGIGLIDTNHFVFVVVDGRSPGYSRGVTMTEFAQIFRSLGAKLAYNLDGGGSTTMVFNGKLVNNPLGKGNERGTSDILYIA